MSTTKEQRERAIAEAAALVRSGADPFVRRAEQPCPNCDGTGVVAIPYREYDPRRSAGCSACGGSGKLRP